VPPPQRVPQLSVVRSYLNVSLQTKRLSLPNCCVDCTDKPPPFKGVDWGLLWPMQNDSELPCLSIAMYNLRCRWTMSGQLYHEHLLFGTHHRFFVCDRNLTLARPSVLFSLPFLGAKVVAAHIPHAPSKADCHCNSCRCLAALLPSFPLNEFDYRRL
jgi:hypothetical protein